MIETFDDFLPEPAKVRQSALNSGFGTWRPNKGEVGSSVYDGMNFWGDHGHCVAALSEALGRAIYPNSMFFRVTNRSTEGAYVHSDREMGDYTAIVYLSEHERGDSGTGFFRNIRTGEERMGSFAQMAKDREEFARLKREMVEGLSRDWELTRFVVGQYNRALIFEALLFHARHPRHGIGDTIEDGRMVWVCHFGVGAHHG